MEPPYRHQHPIDPPLAPHRLRPRTGLHHNRHTVPRRRRVLQPDHEQAQVPARLRPRTPCRAAPPQVQGAPVGVGLRRHLGPVPADPKVPQPVIGYGDDLQAVIKDRPVPVPGRHHHGKRPHSQLLLRVVQQPAAEPHPPRAGSGIDCGLPGVRVLSGRVHGYHWRTVADLPIDGRRVLVRVRVRRLVCPTRGCRHTFREQLPGVLERYQRRTSRLTRQIKAVVKELAGRAGSRLLALLAMGLSRHTALRTLLRIALPTGRVPRVIGVDDFALRRRRRYAPVVIDAESMSGLTCCLTARPTRWKRGCARIRASRSCAATAQRPTPRPSAVSCPTRCRSPTGGTCGTTSAKRR